MLNELLACRVVKKDLVQRLMTARLIRQMPSKAP